MFSLPLIVFLLLSTISLRGQTNAATIPVSARQASGTLLTLDLCRATDECARPDGGFNFCFSVNRGAIGATCRKDLPTCRCIPEVNLESCTASDASACLEGEVCVSYTPGTSGPLAVVRAGDQLDAPFCASAEAEKQLSDLELVSASGSEPTGNDTVVDLTTPFSTNGGLNFDTCRQNADCISPGATGCLGFNSGFVGEPCSDLFPTCRCVSLLRACEKDGDCIVGEVCAIYTRGSEGNLLEVRDSFEDLDSETPFCVSEDAEKSFTDFEKYPASSPPAKPTGEGSVVDTVTPINAQGGTTLASCTEDGDCMSPSSLTLSTRWRCGSFELGNVGNPCIDVESCRCVPNFSFYRRCTDNSFCMVGEGCVKFIGERGTIITQIDRLDFTRSFCMSLEAAEELDDVELLATPSPAPPSTAPPSTAPPSTTDSSGGSDSENEDTTNEDTTNGDTNEDTTNEDTANEAPSNDGSGDEEGDGEADSEGDEPADGEVCIDARAVAHLGTDQLAFKKHVLARVLCDENESCATSGHMVIFHGQAMRMSAYCQVTACYKKNLYVNSPRYGRSLRIQSRTEGLEFTAFAARFDTRAEEILLTAAVRVGL